MEISYTSASFSIHSDTSGIVIKKNKTLYFSGFMMDELDQYLADNYDLLKAEGATYFRISNNVKSINEWTMCDTNYTVIATFPSIPAERISERIEDFDIDVNYKRFFREKTLTEIDGKPAVRCNFYIAFESMNPEEMEIALLRHYESFLALGITQISMNGYNISNYRSDDIIMTILLPEPTNIVDPKL